MVIRRRTLLLAGAASAVPSWAHGQCVTDTVAVDACRGGVYVGGAPSLDLNFAGGTLDPRITFTRAAGPATYFDASGVLQTAGTNVARFDYDPVTHVPRGLLLEEARTNLAQQSGDFTQVIWNKAGVTLSAGIAGPNGATTGSGVVVGSGGAGFLAQPMTGTAGTTYTMSCFAKMAGQQQTVLLMPAAFWADALLRSATFNLSTGVVSTTSGGGVSATIIPVGNGWYRITMTCTPDLSVTSPPQFGRSTTVGDNVTTQYYAFGAQIEVGAFPTSYIPTTGAAATRAAEVATMPWSVASAFTLNSEYIVPYATLPTGSGFVSLQVDNGGNTEVYAIRQNNVTAMQASVFAASASVLTGGSGGPFTANTLMKHAAAFDTVARTGLMVANGAAPVALTFSATPASPTRMMIGTGRVTAIGGWISRVRYWSRQLSATELQAATT